MTKICTEQIIKEAEDYKLVRSKERQKNLGEVFTPTLLVLDILRKLPKDAWKEDKTFLDPAVGNGQFLAPILIIKLQLGHNPEQALSTIYGVDIMPDNVEECRNRLADIMWDENFCPGVKNLSPATKAERTKYIKKILEQNIICADGLKYDYEFNKKQTDTRIKELIVEEKNGGDIVEEVNNV